MLKKKCSEIAERKLKSRRAIARLHGLTPDSSADVPTVHVTIAIQQLILCRTVTPTVAEDPTRFRPSYQ